MGTQPTTAPRGGSIMVNLFDGTRRQVPDGTDVLITVKDGNQNIVKREDYTHPSVFFQGLQVFGNFGDDYTVVASAKNCGDTGFFPVHIAENVVQIVDLMLLPKDGGFNFNAASWKKLKQARPVLAAILAEGVTAGGGATAVWGFAGAGERGCSGLPAEYRDGYGTDFSARGKCFAIPEDSGLGPTGFRPVLCLC
jgi:hypothetical protein